MKRWSSHKTIQIILFALYASCYFISAYYDYKIFDIEYVALTLILVYSLIVILRNYNGVITGSMKYYANTKNMVIMTVVLVLISLAFQLIHMHLFSGTIKQAIYLMCPAVVVFLLNLGEEDNSDEYFSVVLVFAVIYFAVRFKGMINLRTISTISFLDSYSPFEVGTTSITDIFFYCTAFFAYRKKYIRMGVSAIFGILSFKRLMVLGILVTLLLRLISSLRGRFSLRKSSAHTKYSYVPGIWRYALLLFICATPLVMHILMSDSFGGFVGSLVGMDINTFIKGRFDLLNYIVDAKPENYGLGTITNFMKNSSVNYVRGAGNLHNDLYRLYYETTIIGLFAYAWYMIKNAQSEIKTFALTAFFLVNLLVSNSLTNFMPMMLFHMLCAEFLDFEEEDEENTK